jgi:hypothetical protein
MDNIGNLQSINIGYGPLVSKVFDILDKIQVSPDVESDTFMQAKERSLIKIFNQNLGKMSENFEDGFILMTTPLGTVMLLVSFSLFNSVYHFFYFPLHKRVFTTHNPYKRSILLKSFKFRLFNKTTKLLYDLHQFVFNLYVLDLAGGALYEIVQSNFLTKMFDSSISGADKMSCLLSGIVMSIIVYEFLLILLFKTDLERTLTIKKPKSRKTSSLKIFMTKDFYMNLFRKLVQVRKQKNQLLERKQRNTT